MTTETEMNSALWREVQETNPAYTKEYSGPGGFTGTAINGHYAIKRATEVFGPVGIGWGYEIEEERFDQGGPLKTPEGVPQVFAVVHTLKVRLWYMQGDKKGTVTHYGHTPYISVNKYGIQTDMEAPKKSLTDALKKCLSMLGFAADIFLGMFDDIHYVEEKRNEFAIESADNKIDEKVRQAEEFKEWLDNNVRLIESAQTLNELKMLNASAVRKLAHRNDQKNTLLITKATEKRKAELEGKANEAV